jgi:hypothetical protein
MASQFPSVEEQNQDTQIESDEEKEGGSGEMKQPPKPSRRKSIPNGVRYPSFSVLISFLGERHCQ